MNVQIESPMNPSMCPLKTEGNSIQTVEKDALLLGRDIDPVEKQLNLKEASTTDTCTDTESESSSSSYDLESKSSSDTHGNGSDSESLLYQSIKNVVKQPSECRQLKKSTGCTSIQKCKNESVSDRLYNHSILMQKAGKERRQEIYLRSKAKQERENLPHRTSVLPSSMNHNMYYKGLHFIIEKEQKKIAVANAREKEFNSIILSNLQNSFKASE